MNASKKSIAKNQAKVNAIAWLTIGVVIAILAYVFSGMNTYAS